MGGNRNSSGNRNSGKRSSRDDSRHAGKAGGGGAGGSGQRNEAPSSGNRVTIGKANKGKHAMTAVPGKELKAAAGRMMANVVRRRRKEAQHLPGAEAAKMTLRNNKNHNFAGGDNNNNDEDDEGEDEDASRQKKQRSVLRQTTAMAMDARTRSAYHTAAENSIKEQHQQAGDDDASGMTDYKEKSLKRFFKNVKDVIDQSDVLLEVVDARDPMGCRLSAVEDMIENEFGGKKKIVLVINKADLLPAQHNAADHRHAPGSKQQQQQQQHGDEPEAVVPLASWLRYFRESEDVRISEVCPFTCSSNYSKGAASSSYEDQQYGNGGQFGVTQEWCVQNIYSVLRRLATVDGGGGVRKNINVGVIGYPNVGKSSIINALRGKAVVGVGNTPGFTTGNQTVDLRKDIKIIDCPGVVMPGEDAADIVLRNAAKIERLHDPVIVVARLLARCDPVALAMYYDIPIPHVPAGLSAQQYGDAQVMNAVLTFLQNVAWKRGRVRHSGKVDEEDAARLVLKDWNDGRISYYSLPPEIDRFTFSGMATTAAGTRNSDNGGGGPQMMSSVSSSSIVFGRTHLPRFFIQMPQAGGADGDAGGGNGAGEFRVAWNQDSMFRAAPGADAPICYNPLDNIDLATGQALDGGKKAKKKKQQQQVQGSGDADSTAQEQQQTVAQQFLSELYDD